MTRQELKEFLETKVEQYNTPEFLETDPICIPHSFDKKEDIEISAFLTATIAWGNRKSIIKNARQLTELMDQYVRLGRSTPGEPQTNEGETYFLPKIEEEVAGDSGIEFK